MKVLVACEESQRVCTAFRERGHEAYSCDIQECSGGHPEWHIMGDVIPIINGYRLFWTMDGVAHDDVLNDPWDLIIAHPPCTYLAVSGNRWFNVEKYGEKANQRKKDSADAASFFLLFANADCDKIAIENPVGYMSSYYRQPDQIIQPWQFGHPVSKKTCLWLKGLTPLAPTQVVEPGKTDKYGFTDGAALQMARDKDGKIIPWNDPRTAKARSKTFPGIAKAMAEQWG